MNYIDIQSNFLTVTKGNSISKIIKQLNEYISKNACEKLSIDISVLGIMDAINVGALCSTHHFIRYPFGSVEWIVKDIETRNSLKMLLPKTGRIVVKHPIIRELSRPLTRKVVAIR